MQQYHDLLKHVLENGVERKDRTGTGTIGVFGTQTRYDLDRGFPLVTTKKVFWKGVVEELLWFLRGESNVKSLQEAGVHIWDEWAKENGDLGPVYGAQWRSWARRGEGWIEPCDQIDNLIEGLKTDPWSRRHIVSAWNVGELPYMALPPCHLLFQFYVTNDHRLHCQLYQRSADLFLGVPFNIASYALLIHLVSHMTGLFPGEFVHTIGDAHIYLNHIDQVKEQLARTPRPLPALHIKHVPEKIEQFKFDDIELIGYNPYPAIKGKVSV